MIPYMVGKLSPNPLHLTRGLVKHVPGRGYFRAIPSQNGDKYVTSPPPPIVELVACTALFRPMYPQALALSVALPVGSVSGSGALL